MCVCIEREREREREREIMKYKPVNTNRYHLKTTLSCLELWSVYTIQEN